MYPFFISFCSGVLVLSAPIYPTGCTSAVGLNIQLSTILSLPGHLVSFFSWGLGNCRQPHQQKSNLSKCICKQESCFKDTNLLSITEFCKLLFFGCIQQGKPSPPAGSTVPVVIQVPGDGRISVGKCPCDLGCECG